MANDPVCGMYVDEKSGLISEKDERKYYFCSKSCKVQFDRPEKEMKIIRIALMISWPISIFILLATYVFPHITYEPYLLLALASIVQFYPGRRFYAGVLDAIKNRSSNMDTLIAIGTSAAWAYSAFVVLFPNILPIHALYFDTSTLIIALILTGTYMQRLVEIKASSSVEKLMALQPKIAHLIKNDNTTEDIPIAKINKGDIILVKPGETIPTDSIIIDGDSSVDESMISGESIPITKKINDSVTGGTINSTGVLKIKAVKVGKDTTLAQIIEVVRDATSSKVPIQKLVNKVSSYFVPVVILVAIVSGLLWFFVGQVIATYALLVFVSVLIIACPCALGIATPAALMVSSGISAKRGILIKSGEALERSNKIDTVILDKTGTLTVGKPEVTDILVFDNNKETKKELLLSAAEAEMNSEHVIGKAIVNEAIRHELKPKFPKTFKYTQGSGVSASINNKNIIIGNRDLFKKSEIDKIKDLENSIIKLENEGKTVMIVSINNKIKGIIAVADVIRETSKGTIEEFNKINVEVWMVTGDNERTAKYIANKLNIKNIIAGAKPKMKLEAVEKLQKEGKVVAMVGDGINDAPALAKADVGIAIGAGTDIAKETGSIVLIRNDIHDVVTAIKIGRITMKKIKQNLIWAFGYNIILIPIAAGILVPIFGIGMYNVLPMAAAGAMALSSITVVSNSLLLSKNKSIWYIKII